METSNTARKPIPKILILEDTPSDFEQLRASICREMDCELVQVQDQASLEAALSQDQFDLVLCNCDMPGCDGLTALKQAQSLQPEVPVIMIPGESSESKGISFTKLGATACLSQEQLDQLAPTALRVLEEAAERKGAEQVAGGSGERFRLLIEQSSDIFWFAELDPLRIVYVSPSVESVTGRPAEFLYGDLRSSWLGIVHEEDKNLVLRTIEDLCSGRADNYDYEYRIVRPDGEIRWIHDVGAFGYDESRRPNSISSVSRDITAQKRAEEEVRRLNENLELKVDERIGELRASERRFRATFNQAAVGIAHVSKDGLFLRFNQRLCDMLGYTQRELSTLTFQEITHPEDTAADLEQMKLLFAGQIDSFEVEKRYIGKNGAAVWVDLTGSVVLDEKGDIEYAVVIITDITERKRTEDALYKSERFSRASINALSTHLSVIDEDGQIIATNAAWDRFAKENGAAPNRVTKGANYLKVCDEAKGKYSSEAHLVARGIREIIAGRIPEFIIEYPCHSDTEERWFVCRATRFMDDGPIRIVVAHENITRVKLVQIQLSEQQELNRITLENVMDGVVVCNQNFKLTTFNRAAREWHGIDVRDIDPEKWADFYGLMEGDGTTPMPMERVPLFRAMRGEVVAKASMCISRTDRTLYFIECDAAPLFDESGKLRGAVAVMHDITERHRLDNLLLQSLQEKETLLKEIHHRVKNNLQIVTSLLDMQIGKTADPTIKESLLESANRVRAMATIHERLYRSSSLARIDFSEYAEILSNALFRSYAIKGEVEFIVEAERVELGIETAVPCGLILNELISNACKHAFFPKTEGQQLRVTLKAREGDGFDLTVQDNGPGLPADFDIQRVSTLGLLLVESLVGQLNGHLDVRNEGGALFHLRVDSPQNKK